MSDSVNSRKVEHIKIVENDNEIDRRKYYFDDVHLQHRGLPELAIGDVDTSVEFMGKTLSFPLLISSMTGGDHDLIKNINRNLALAAEHTGVAMGVGSQRVMFANPEASESFEIRQFAPTALLFSNLGAVQLNYGFDIATCRRAIDGVQADGLYLHLNPLQEVIQPEGDTDFSGLAAKIGMIVDDLEFPVIVKEVGCGLSVADTELLVTNGVEYIDVAGSGGTSWSRIEHYRQKPDGRTDLGVLFQDWGIPTPIALRQLASYRDRVTLIGSGGIRNGIDMVKALILGASLCGLASPFLHPAMESSEAVIAVIEGLKKEFVTAMFLLGAGSVTDLIGNNSLIRNTLP